MRFAHQVSRKSNCQRGAKGALVLTAPRPAPPPPSNSSNMRFACQSHHRHMQDTLLSVCQAFVRRRGYGGVGSHPSSQGYPTKRNVLQPGQPGCCRAAGGDPALDLVWHAQGQFFCALGGVCVFNWRYYAQLSSASGSVMSRSQRWYSRDDGDGEGGDAVEVGDFARG